LRCIAVSAARDSEFPFRFKNFVASSSGQRTTRRLSIAERREKTYARSPRAGKRFTHGLDLDAVREKLAQPIRLAA
jgi:hypothetical protein